MKKKFLIYIPMVFIIFGTLILAVAVYNQNSKNKIELPLIPAINQPTPTDGVSSPSATPLPIELSRSQKLQNDLKEILIDINRVKKEDKRFVPPSFVFDLGI